MGDDNKYEENNNNTISDIGSLEKTEDEPVASEPVKKPKNKKTIIVVASIVVLATVVFTVWFFLFNKPTGENEADEITAESLVIDNKEDLQTAKEILNNTVNKPTEEQEELKSEK
ncbi:MAG: hypothetical protein WBI29_02750 [Candidatus Saccharimonadales bacterium]